MFIFLFLALLRGASPDAGGGQPTIMPIDPYAYNLTVTDLSPRSMSLRWSCKNHHLHDKYEVTLKPLKATYRVVETVPHNSCFLTMDNLVPDTDYQVSITLFSRSFRRRSNTLTVKTPLEEPEVELDESLVEDSRRELRMPRVRLVELSLVGLALILWAGAIVLFFHRWGKIRMLLPYQPDFKEQMKPNGSTCTNCSLTPHHQCSRLQHMTLQADYAGLNAGALGPVGLVTVDSGCSPMRPRLNSFIGYNASDIPIPMEIRICRKSKSAEQLPLSPKYDDEIEFSNF